jgi:DNA-binding response OmpR family regulator
VDSPSHTVLVVDDDASIRLLCRVNLQLDGWTVREAGTLAEARTELSQGGVDVVLLDVHVGTGDGLEFLAELRREQPGLPVAMLTGSTDSRRLDRAQANAVLAKPFTLDELSETVRGLASRTGGKAG